jgi:hypothetical protein
MRNSVSEFFLLELEGWNESLTFYKQEISRSSDWLKSILQLNTVPGLATRVEYYMDEYLKVGSEIEQLLEKITKMNSDLNEDELPEEAGPVKDAFITAQKELRSGMQTLEKKYLELKYECDEFVAATLAVQQHR